MTKQLGWLAAGAVALIFAGVSSAQQIAALPPPIPAPRDVPYPAGPITIDVDATNTAQGIFSVHEVAPVSSAGPITLLYPRWLPGNHGPSGPINQLAGLVVRGNGQAITWHRDTVDVYAFHIDVPA